MKNVFFVCWMSMLVAAMPINAISDKAWGALAALVVQSLVTAILTLAIINAANS